MNNTVRKCNGCPVPDTELCPGMANTMICENFIDKAGNPTNNTACPITGLVCDMIPCPGKKDESYCRKNEPAPLPPSLLQKAINLGVATVKHALDGFANVEKDYYEKRLDICSKCDHRSLDEENPDCLICGCPVKVKAKWRSEECPIGKWKAQLEDEPEKAPDVAATPLPIDGASTVPVKQQTPPRAAGSGCGCGK